MKDKNINVNIISLGCARNLVDSETIAYYCKKEGWNLIDDLDRADVVIINSCGFIEASKIESIDTVLECLDIKGRKSEENKDLIVVLAGCLAQRNGKELSKEFSDIDLIVGVEQYPNIVKYIKGVIKKKNKEDKTDKEDKENTANKYGCIYIDRDKSIYNREVRRVNTSNPGSSYLKVSEGCRHRCAFCMIPSIRGKLKSVPIHYLIKEAKSLAKNGVKEINLIAQDLSDYGRDLIKSENLKDKESNLYNLVERLSDIEGIDWIRLLYYYPEYINKKFINMFRSNPKLTRYLDIPIQHVSDKILSSMKRNTSFKEIESNLEMIKEELPDMVLRTSIIVGFPGETKKDFDKLLKFVEKGWFDNLGCFAYSDEEGSLSYTYSGKVSDKEKQHRLDLVMKVQQEVSRKKLENKVGCIYKVLIDETENMEDAGNSFKIYKGRTYFQAPEVDGSTYIEDYDDVDNELELGKFYDVKIVRTGDYDLIGNVIKI